MRVEGNVVHKCIHEAMDLWWCDCDEETRIQCNVTLPPPPSHWCECCDEDEAEFTMSMINSQSAANLVYGCASCVQNTVNMWLLGTDYDDTDGWEINRI